MAAWTLAFALLAGLAGCGDSGMPLVPVSGRVTFNGAPPPYEGDLMFVQRDGTGLEGLPARTGIAQFGREGRFEVRSFQPGDGLLPGKYQVRVACVDGQGVNYVAPDFRPDDLVVAEGQRKIEVNYDVPVATGAAAERVRQRWLEGSPAAPPR